MVDFAQAAKSRQVDAFRRYVEAFDRMGVVNMALLYPLQAGAHASLGHRRLGIIIDVPVMQRSYTRLSPGPNGLCGAWCIPHR
jgi:hypothetical protein